MADTGPGPKTPRVVLDSNVWISGLVFGGSPGEIIELFIRKEITVVSSEELLSEIRRNIVQKFPALVPQLGLLEASISKDAFMVPLGSLTIKASRDPDDDKILEAAMIGGCGYIVSGDKDLLSLGGYQGIAIVSQLSF